MRIENYKLKFIYVFAALLGYLFISQTTNAASLSLSIDPSIMEINAIPPANLTSLLNIKNKGDGQVTLQIQLKPFKARGENGELEYLREAPGIFKNIQILDEGAPVESITLEPAQEKTLSLALSIPQDTKISDYYFSVLFVSTNSSPVESNSSINHIGIASNVLLSIGSAETPKATIEQFSSNVFFEKGPVPFTVRIKNTGIHFVKPKGEITIKNMFGQNVGKLDLTSVNVLSSSVRAIPNNIYMQEIKNSSDFKHPIVLWKESFLLGFYTATLNISMSNGGPNFTRSINFFAFPLQILIIIVIIAIAAIVIRNRLKLHANKNRT